MSLVMQNSNGRFFFRDSTKPTGIQVDFIMSMCIKTLCVFMRLFSNSNIMYCRFRAKSSEE